MISANYVDGLELRIKELTLSNQNLTTALQKVSDYNLRLEESQKSFISALAKSDEYITKLENERDALAAQVELFRQADRDYKDSEISRYEFTNKVMTAIDTKPSQCLAEIKAEAIESLLPKCIYSTDHKVEVITKDMVKYFANQVRQGGER